MNKKLLSEILRNSTCEKLLVKKLGRYLDIDIIRHDLNVLKRLGQQISDRAIHLVIKEIRSTLKDIPELIRKELLSRKSIGLEHLFHPSLNITPEKEHYLLSLENLTKLVKELEGNKDDTVLINQLDGFGRVLYSELSGKIERYSDLRKETGAFNTIMKYLYPSSPIPDRRMDAHHIIEERLFEKFKSDWALLGWESPNDMPAISLLTEYHIRSLQPGRSLSKESEYLADLAEAKSIYSLSKELEREIDIKAFKTVEEVLKAYKNYYLRQMNTKSIPPRIRNSILDTLDAVENELSKQKNLQKLFKGLKDSNN